MLKTYCIVCLPLLLILMDHARCESDYTLSLQAGGWLKLYTTPETWEEAFLRCRHNGAVLASPLTTGLANALQLQMAQFGVNGKIFLGTHDLFSKGHFISVEGVPLSNMDIRQWGSQCSPDNAADTGDCLTMSTDGSMHYSSCTDPLPFICYKNTENQTINECGTFDNGYQLNQQTGSCYKIHPYKVTWTRAYSICASEGGHLVILNNAEEARIVKDLFPRPPKSTPSWEGFFIGLVAWGKERTWATIHGDKIEDVYNKWDSGEPNNYLEVEDRAQCLWNGNLDDTSKDNVVNKASTRMFACEKSPQF